MSTKIIILTIALNALGIITQRLFGVGNMTAHFIFSLIGLGIYFIIRRVDADYLTLLSAALTVVGFVLLLLLLIIADPTRGSRRWFFVGGFGIQPSILFVPFFMVLFSHFLAQRRLNTMLNVITTALPTLIPIILIFKQPDLGTSIIWLLTIAALLFYQGLKLKHIAIVSSVLLPFLLIIPKLLKPYQLQRLLSFLNPNLDPSGINYNSLQSVIAIGSGGLLGKGILKATQSKLFFLPEAHTDFVFAAYTESFGFVGAIILLVLYGSLFYSLLKELDAKTHSTKYNLYTIGVFIFLFTQFTFNIGMNLRLFPVVGIPLPLISYGGSTIVTTYILLAIHESMKRST